LVFSLKPSVPNVFWTHISFLVLFFDLENIIMQSLDKPLLIAGLVLGALALATQKYPANSARDSEQVALFGLSMNGRQLNELAMDLPNQGREAVSSAVPPDGINPANTQVSIPSHPNAGLFLRNGQLVLQTAE
jgi:hypothetical protein